MNINIKTGYTKEVNITEIEAKSILRKHKRMDSWFLSKYGMNLYQGCTHDCVYCDGRYEGYYIKGEFGRDVAVKVNAVEILRRELDPKRKRIPLKKYYMMLGGGVGDSYQPAEKKYKLIRKAMQLVQEFEFPVHILTKSTLVERDIDILKQINQSGRAIVSFSFSSVNDKISSVFEPGVPSPSDRLKTIKKIRDTGIVCGMYLMPVIPFLTDTPEMIEESVYTAKKTGIEFVIFSGMTLKEGRQKDFFMSILKNEYPELVKKYESIYRGSEWGEAEKEYYHTINKTFYKISKKYKMPVRMPLYLFKDIFDENDLIIILFEHIDYMLKLKGEKSPFGYAAYKISQLKEPVSTVLENLPEKLRISKNVLKQLQEIQKTGSCSLYEKLISE